MFSSRMRVTGFSGMDVDSMVRQLMDAESTRLHRLQRTHISTGWKQEAYRGVADSFRAFQRSFLDISSPSTNMRGSTALNKFSTETSGATRSATVTTRGDTVAGDYSVTVLSRLSGASYTGSNTNASSPSATAESILAAAKATTPQGINFTVSMGGPNVEVSLSAQDIIDLDDEVGNDPAKFREALAQAINNQLEEEFGTELPDEATPESIITGDATPQSKVRVSFSENGGMKFNTNAGNVYTISNASGALSDLEGTNNNTSMRMDEIFDAAFLENNDTITINGKEISLKSADGESWLTVRGLMNRVNGSAAGVTMAFDATTSSFSITSKKEGASSKINIGAFDEDGNPVAGDSTQDFFKKAFNIDASEGSSDFRRGTDAVVSISEGGGPARTLTSSTSNSIVDDGFSNLIIAANSVSPIGDDGRVQPTEVSVNVDRSATADTIREFINAYNDLLGSLNAHIDQPRARSDRYTLYEPLLDHEREALSDSEAEKMDSKAREGILNRDPMLQQSVNWLREAFLGSVDLGNGNSIRLMDIGITTSKEWNEKGRLIIDEDKLSEALEKRFDDVVELFTKDGPTALNILDPNHSATVQSAFASQGFAERLNVISELMANRTSGILSRHAGNESGVNSTDTTMHRQLREQQDRINRMIDILTRKEDDYYRRFNAMEQAMVKGESQMAALMSQLG